MAESSGIRAGKSFVELSLSDKFTKALDQCAKKLKAFGDSITKIGKATLGIGTAITAPLLVAAQRFASVGSEINDMSARTGVGVEALQELMYAAAQTGAEAEDLETGIKKMSKAIFEAETGSQGARDSLAAIGLTARDLKGLAPEAQFRKIAAGISSITDPTARSAIAMELLGKSGTKLIPTMQELTALTEKYRALGLGIDPKDVAAADRFGDTLDDLWQQFNKIVIVVGATVAEALQPFLDAATKVLRTVIDWISKNRNVVLTVLGVGLALVTAGGALISFGLAIKAVGFAISGITSTFGLIGSALTLLVNPVVLVGGALIALAAYFLYTSGRGQQAIAWLSAKFQALKATVNETVGGIADALAAGDIQLAAQILWTGLKLLWIQGTQELQAKWSEMKAGMVKVWVALQYGFLDVVTNVWADIQEVWAQSAGFFVNLWQGAINKVGNLFSQDAADRAALEEKSRIDRDVAAGKITQAQGDKQKRNVDAQKDQVLAANQKKQDEERTARAKELQDRLQAIEEQRKAALKKHSDEELGVSAGADANAKKEIADLEKEKGDLQKKLDDLRKRAGDEKGQADNAPPLVDPNKLAISGDDVINSRVKVQPAAIGTFNARALQALRTDPVQNEIKKNTAESVKVLKTIAAKKLTYT